MRGSWSTVKVLFVTSECFPLVKTGGLADVAGALPLALSSHGTDARVLLPAYQGVVEQVGSTEIVASVANLFGGPATVRAGTTAQGLQMLLLDAPHLFLRPGGPYLAPDGKDWPDNHLRFAALSMVGARIATGELLPSWTPELVHLHDWQAALTAAYLHFHKGPTPPTLLTIHNLAFQGVFPTEVLKNLKLPAAAGKLDAMEYWGKLSFLKAGVKWCDHVNTVSPTYAREILTGSEGMGFDGLLRERGDHVTGIVNGIDTTVWNPATDPLLAANYNSRSLHLKAVNKRAVQEQMRLPVEPDAPLFCVVSRLTEQKGLDLLADALPHLAYRGAQIAVLGTGDRAIELALHRAAELHPRHVAVRIGYDEGFAHLLQAGADAVLMPSRFEPCGLSQLYGLRYGTIPVVARVGGLADTVVDANTAALSDGVATGFQFSPVDHDNMKAVIDRVCDLWADRTAWTKLVRRAMGRTVGWSKAAQDYLELYERVVQMAQTR